MTDLAQVTYAGRLKRDFAAVGRDGGFAEFLERWDEEDELARLTQQGILWIPFERLPDRLTRILDAPRGLFARAHPTGHGPLVSDALAASPAVAVVGARACTDYGAHVARSASRRLAEEGVTIVSGLARGVDAHAHRGALDAQGVTIAVLGCGIDVTYPRAHAQLADEIVERGGLVVSEYPPGVPPAPWRFPARNRIVAGLSDACLVVEARERSGSLITVDLAMEAGRPIFAVPGEIQSLTSAGPNQLIRAGSATAFLGHPDEILDALVAAEAS